MLRRLFGLLLLAAVPAWATSTNSLSLEELVSHSALAFEGTCVENRSARDPQTQLIVTYTTFAVREVLQGAAPATYTIKQLGGELPAEGVVLMAPHVPRFEPGAEYVVFLPAPSRLGFSSPTALSQGQFRVERGAGKARVANGAQAAADLDEFKQAVRERAGRKP